MRFPRLNLARSGASRLSILFTYELNGERRARLAEYFDDAPVVRTQSAAFSLTRYKTRGAVRTVHVAAAMFARNQDSPDDVHAFIGYYWGLDSDLPKKSFGIPGTTFLDIARNLGEPKQGSGVVTFQFENREPTDLWFPLPVSLSGESPEDAFEIRGVRGAKINVQDGETEYTFVLDRSDNEQVVLQAAFTLEGPLIPETPRLLFERAEHAVRDLIVDS